MTGASAAMAGAPIGESEKWRAIRRVIEKPCGVQSARRRSRMWATSAALVGIEHP